MRTARTAAALVLALVVYVVAASLVHIAMMLTGGGQLVADVVSTAIAVGAARVACDRALAPFAHRVVAKAFTVLGIVWIVVSIRTSWELDFSALIAAIVTTVCGPAVFWPQDFRL